MKRYTQTTYESCLACCLLQAVDRVKPIEINQKLELDCVNHSMKFSKEDFVIGHLDFIAKQYNIPFKRIVDNKQVHNYLKTLKFSKKIKTEVKKIDIKLIDKYIDKQPIIAIDFYYLLKAFPYHYPHFITVLGKKGDKYHIFDTWQGKERYIDREMLAEALYSLRDYILFSPEMIFSEAGQNKQVLESASHQLLEKIRASIK